MRYGKALCDRARDVLRHRIRPRDEVVAVRQHLARELARSLGAEQLRSPLSLVDPDAAVAPSAALPGVYREYTEAARRNLEIRAEFAALRGEHDASIASLPAPPGPDDADARLLALQLEVGALEQERERLEVVDRYLGELDRLPAAAPDFLDPDVMFAGCAPLPELPKDVVAGFAEDRDAPDREVRELLSRLQKAVLRNKLLAQREKQNFEKLKAQSPLDPSSLPPAAQLHALNAVKDSLIGWIETMLAQAGGDEDDAPGAGSPTKLPAPKEKEDLDREARAAEIQQEYAHHVDLRKEIFALVAQLKQLKAAEPPPKPEPVLRGGPVPSSHKDAEAYLLTPYLEKLQAISREQKGLIQEKSYINSLLARQQHEFNQMIDHLAEESHLLQTYPTRKNPASSHPDDAEGSGRSKLQPSFGEATKGAGAAGATSIRKSNTTRQIEPWIAAANSAQIATLEAVFEKVEEGQAAVEDAMQALDEVRRLLNVDGGDGGGEQDEGREGEAGAAAPAERDIWLADEDGGPAAGRERSTRRSKKGKARGQPGESIYAQLDGNLGLINE
ncbi:hypothetical protein GGS23DRAFT_603071 [Durotheca rogersii]|uniref:uncharacterized protein n=1 Tax=Durotheca rogersii TaxID=419775 RepID=UPI00222116CC|nr:uncharacterized protein GGS23DRAFT_603071 [Durotheca rogersii]KAI5866861.1 hypothetical protein GGS23DRAFT_603071 [Durotheca rogersii]